jgi:YD repeat-containing protein
MWRRLLVGGLITVATIVITIAATVATVRWAGPMSSGAVDLLRPLRATAEHREFSDSYQPRHKGYIDLGTGLYIRDDEDLIVRGVPPLVFQRTYRSRDREVREFGVGTTHNGELYLVGDPNTFQWIELILPTAGRIRFERTSPGTSYINAVFMHRSPSAEWDSAQLGWVGSEWVLRRSDGTRMRFLACGAGLPVPACSIVQELDSDGHATHYRRDQTGRLLRIEAEERWIALEYDDRGRISRASDNAKRSVRYEYDGGGRLARVTTSDGIEHRYEYTALDEMALISDPGKIIENVYEDGRVVKQVNRFPNDQPYVFQFTWMMTAGRVAEVESKRSDGTWTRYSYNTARYSVKESHGMSGMRPLTFEYTRDPVTNVVTSMVVTCPGRTGAMLRHSTHVRRGYEEWIKRDMVRTHCAASREDWSLPAQ